MTPMDVKNKYKTGYQFKRLTGMAETTFRNWLNQGYIPLAAQKKLEKLTKGELISSDNDADKKTGGLLFRFHRGSLVESMRTVITVFSLIELNEHIYEYFDALILPINFRATEDGHTTGGSLECYGGLTIEKYIFDERINWNTHLVSTLLMFGTKFVVGYLSDSPDLWDKEEEN